MKSTILIIALSAAISCSASAQLNIGAPAPLPAAVTAAPVHALTIVPPASAPCELLATNTIRAELINIAQRDNPDLSRNDKIQVAYFRVLENLAYKRISRYGGRPLQQGENFALILPSQAAEVRRQIEQMQPSDEAVLKINEIIAPQPNGRHISSLSCERIARRNAPPQHFIERARIHQSASTVTNPSNSYSSEERIETGIINGVRSQTHTKTTRELDHATGQIITRIYINGIELDPVTKKPLNGNRSDKATAAPTTTTIAPAPAPIRAATAPQAQQANDEAGTILEHSPAQPKQSNSSF